MKGLSVVRIPSKERYSIGCILFKKESWFEIDNGSNDDEEMFRRYAELNGSVILADRSVPFVHMAYFSQREENRDIVAKAREIYQTRTGHPFPLGLVATRELELEARLRWLERKIDRKPASRGRLKSVERAIKKLLYRLGLRKKVPA